MNGPAGLAGHTCLASFFFIARWHLTLERLERLERLMDSVRVLAPVMEPAAAPLRALRNTWRQDLLGKSPASPRILAM